MELFSKPEIIWLIAGILLLLLEFAIPGILVVFFGIGALITALLTYLTGMGLCLQFVSFIFFSLLFLFLLRKKLMAVLSGSGGMDPDEEFIGRQATAETDLPAGGTGKIVFKGTLWNAKSETLVEKGNRVVITGKDGITLLVKPDSFV